MSPWFRAGLWCILLCGNTLAIAWELVVVQGAVLTRMLHGYAKPKLKLVL
jgi:hypothetical protein